MKGILIVSNGGFAKGLADTVKVIFGNNIEQLEYCCFEPGMSISAFQKQLKKKHEITESGEGVIVLLDTDAGIVYREALKLLDDQSMIIAGVNVPLLLDILIRRANGDVLEKDALLRKGRAGIHGLDRYFGEMSQMVEG